MYSSTLLRQTVVVLIKHSYRDCPSVETFELVVISCTV